jgi:trigger factor
MATINRENIGILTDKITVKITQEDYLPSFEKALKNYSKQANIPGFRKGMVPTGVIKKMYGNSVFAEEVYKSVEKELSQYMASEKLNIFAQPLPLPQSNPNPIDMGKPDEYSFAFEIGLKPDFVLPAPEELKPVRYRIQVTDKMIEDEIDRLRSRHGKMTEPDSINTEENILKLSFTESDEKGEPKPEGLNKELSLPFRYFKEESRKPWIGKKKDEFEVLRLSDAFEEKERDWVAKELGLVKDGAPLEDPHFKIQITGIGLAEKAPLNEDLYLASFRSKGIQGEEEFRNAVRDEIQHYLDEQSRGQLYHRFYHELLDHTQINFPEPFLKRWMQQTSENAKSPGEIDQEFPVFESQLKWTLIMDRISRENQLEVSVEDLRNFAKKQLLGYMGRAASDEEQPWVSDYVNRMIQDKKFVEETAQRIQSDKIFEWIEGRASITEKPVSVEEFNEMQKEHEHHHH